MRDLKIISDGDGGLLVLRQHLVSENYQLLMGIRDEEGILDFQKKLNTFVLENYNKENRHLDK